MLAELRHWEFAWRVWNKMAWAVWAGQLLLVDLALQRHEGMDERFGSRWTAGDVHVHRDVAVNALEHVVALLERPAGDGTRAHGDDVFRLRHLVVEAHHLRGHFLGHRASHDHEVSLARR